LVYPANGATGIPLTPILIWTHKCIPDSFRLQIATDSLFINKITDQSGITVASYAVLPATMLTNTKYYWRVYGVNVAGTGKWSIVSNFTTLSTLTLVFTEFTGSYNNLHNLINLEWKTSGETNNHYFIIERSTDALVFNPIGNVPALSPQPEQNRYWFADMHPPGGNVFYRLKQVDADGKFSYSNTITVVEKISADALLLFPNPVKDICTLQLPDSRNGFLVTITDEVGSVLLKITGKAYERTVTLNLEKLPPGSYAIRAVELKTGRRLLKKIVRGE
jgi:hypothetical protein